MHCGRAILMGFVFSVAIFGFSITPAFAIGGTISDQSSCEALGFTWISPDECQINGTIEINSGESIISSSSIKLTNLGTINVNDGGFLSPAFLINNGIINVNPNAILDLSYNFINSENHGTITNYGDPFWIAGLGNYGLIENFNHIYVYEQGWFYNDGVGIIDNYGLVTVPPSLDSFVHTYFDNYGTFNNACGSELDISPTQVTTRFGNPINEILCIPNLIQPSDGSTVTEPKPDLIWENDAELRQVAYTPFLEDSLNPGVPIELVSLSLVSAEPLNVLQDGNYDWYVTVDLATAFPYPAVSIPVTSSQFSFDALIVVLDSDGDGIPDFEDQCPGLDDTIDVDSDGIPDCIDPLVDSDGDGVADNADACPGFNDAFDSDGNGIPDGCESLSNLICPSGQFDNGGVCVVCPIGTYQPATGQTSCLSTPPGHFVDETGATSQNQCPPGTSQPLSGQSNCISCDLGTYQPATGQASCFDAQAGHFVGSTASAFQSECPAGTIAPFTGSPECVSCPVGEVPNSSQTACIIDPTIDLQNQISTLQTDLTNCQNQNSQITSDLNQCLDENTALNQQVVDLTNQINEILSQIGSVPTLILQSLISDVQALVDGDNLDNKDSKKIIKDLDKALNDIKKGNEKACKDISKFVKHVEVLVKKGDLTDANAQSLLDEANALLAECPEKSSGDDDDD